MNEFFGQPIGILTKARADALYVLVAGKAGGQTVFGGTAASENLILNSTAHATKGQVRLATATLNVDGSTNRVGINTTSPSQAFQIFDGNLRFDQVAAAGAPTVAINASAGNLNGTYLYAITFVTALGETRTGTTSASVSPSNQQVNLTNIPTSSDPNVTSRKIYRTAAGGSSLSLKLVNTIADNTTTTYTDNLPDGSLGVNMPWRNTTGAHLFNGTTIVAVADEFNTSFGYNAGGNGNTGYLNTAIGASALESITTGAQNLAFGYRSLFVLTTGSANISIGIQAAQNLTTGNFNTITGFDGAFFNQSGSNNSVYGYLAGFGVTGNSYSNNSIFGYQAGQVLTTGSNNVLVGYQAGVNLTSGSNNLVIGYNLSTPSATSSNQMTIGNLIFSAGIDGTGTTLSSGNIGIGVVSPATKLHTVIADSATAAITNAVTFEHQSTGTPASSFGTGLLLTGQSTTTVNRELSRIRAFWQTATDASRKARSIWSVWDTAERDALAVEATGTVAIIDALGTFSIRDGSNNVLSQLLSTGAAIFNEQGAAVDFRVESDNNQNIIFVNGTTDKVAIGVATPALKFTVAAGQYLNDTDGASFATTKFNSQGVAWSTIMTLPSFIFQNGSAERSEISMYRGSRTYPQFSVRMSTTADLGGEFWAGGGTSAPKLHLLIDNTGSQSIFGDGSGAYNVAVKGATATTRLFTMLTSTTARWAFGANSTTESGSNVGSDFALFRYNDAGSFIDTPFIMLRSSTFVGIGTASPSTQLHVILTDAGTNTVVNVETRGHNSSGTPASGFGTGLSIQGQSSTTTNQDMSRMRSLWTTATHASRATRSVLSGFDSTGERDVIGWGADGSNGLLGFYATKAAAPIAQPTVTGSRGSNAALTSLLTQLAALGLIIDSTS